MKMRYERDKYGGRLWPATDAAGEPGNQVATSVGRRRLAYPLGATATTIEDDEVSVLVFELDPAWRAPDGGLLEPSPGGRFVRALCSFTERQEGDNVADVIEAFAVETDAWDLVTPLPESYGFSDVSEERADEELLLDESIQLDLWFEIPSEARAISVIFDPDSEGEDPDAPLVRFEVSDQAGAGDQASVARVSTPNHAGWLRGAQETTT